MKPFLAFLLVATAQLCFAFDLTTYKTTYQAQVSVPYKNAVTIAAGNIIEYLAMTPVPKTAEGGKQVAANLKIQAQFFSSDLGTASKSSDGLRVQLDHEVENLVAQTSGVEKQIAATDQQLQKVSVQIQTSNTEVAEAQNQLNAAQKSVQDAENALHGEEDRVRDAEHCTFIGGWLGHQICNIVNHDGIRNAEGARDRARGDLQGRQQRLSEYQTKLGNQQQQLTNLQQTKSGFEATKNQLTVQHTQLSKASMDVNNVDVQLKAVIAHIGTLFGKSQVLVDVVKDLIDMETVIRPLTAIADQISGFTPNAADVAYLSAMKQKITANLPIVQQKLAQYALIPPSD